MQNFVVPRDPISSAQPAGCTRAASPAPSMCTVYHDRVENSRSNTSIPSTSAKNGPPDLHLLRTDRITCTLSCLCHKRGRHAKRHAPAVEVISHKLYNGICLLLCKLDSPRAAPTYLRQCEVPRTVRIEYHNYYSQHNRPKPLEDFWNAEKERQMRDALFGMLTWTERRVQCEIAGHESTAEWVRKTDNGRCANPPYPILDSSVCASTSSCTSNTDQSETASEFSGISSGTADSRLWQVERVIGAAYYTEGRRTRIWLLIKWKDYDQSENTWEPGSCRKRQRRGQRKRHGVPLKSRMVQAFFRDYGKPNSIQRKILSPEGDKFEKSSGGARFPNKRKSTLTKPPIKIKLKRPSVVSSEQSSVRESSSSSSEESEETRTGNSPSPPVSIEESEPESLYFLG